MGLELALGLGLGEGLALGLGLALGGGIGLGLGLGLGLRLGFGFGLGLGLGLGLALSMAQAGRPYLGGMAVRTMALFPVACGMERGRAGYTYHGSTYHGRRHGERSANSERHWRRRSPALWARWDSGPWPRLRARNHLTLARIRAKPKP